MYLNIHYLIDDCNTLSLQSIVIIASYKDKRDTGVVNIQRLLLILM